MTVYFFTTPQGDEIVLKTDIELVQWVAKAITEMKYSKNSFSVRKGEMTKEQYDALPTHEP